MLSSPQRPQQRAQTSNQAFRKYSKALQLMPGGQATTSPRLEVLNDVQSTARSTVSGCNKILSARLSLDQQTMKSAYVKRQKVSTSVSSQRTPQKVLFQNEQTPTKAAAIANRKNQNKAYEMIRQAIGCKNDGAPSYANFSNVYSLTG